MNPKTKLFLVNAPGILVILLVMFLLIPLTFQEQMKNVEYDAYTLQINDYKDVRMTVDKNIFCGEWNVPIREHLIDSYCIFRNGREMLPLSWTTSKDSVIYEEFMNAVIDTMRTMALETKYIYEEDAIWK